MIRFKTILLFLIAILITILLFLTYERDQHLLLKKQNSNFIIQIDSLQAENNVKFVQLNYLKKYFDSTNKKIPEPNGFAFISDSISNKTK